MNRDRLLHLKHILFNVEQKYKPFFDLTVFISKLARNSLYSNMVDTFSDQIVKLECGFVACAAGFASLDPTFNNQGLYYAIHDKEVRYKQEVGFNALALFFDIKKSVAEWLFHPVLYTEPLTNSEKFPNFSATIFMPTRDPDSITPEMVIRRIDFLLDNEDTLDKVLQNVIVPGF